MSTRGLLGAAVLCAVFGGCGSETEDVNADEPAATAPAESDRAVDGDAELDCNQMSSGTMDVLPPNSVEEARAAGWPSSPEEAANDTVTAPAYVGRLDDVELSEGTTVELPGATNAVRFFAVRPDGHVVGNITVQELLPDVWASAYVSVCSPAS